MDNTKGDNYFLAKIRKDVEYIEKQMKGVSIEALERNEMLMDSMMFRMIQISESSKKLSEEFRQQRKDVPWGMLFGLRNRIVHDYGNVDFGVIYEVLTKDMPALKEILSSW
ncbi:MAG: DUF86 domain-containing protein [Bacillota bacterium]|nr:DUF86 domain-containing protein [Bacillota bacterium]